jgi:hypothetical protein
MLNQDVAGYSSTQRRNHCQAQYTDEVKLVVRVALGFESAAEGSGSDAGEIKE